MNEIMIDSIKGYLAEIEDILEKLIILRDESRKDSLSYKTYQSFIELLSIQEMTLDTRIQKAKIEFLRKN